MSLHQSEILMRLNRFLERRTLPRSLEGKPQAIADELGAMTRIIGRHASKSDFGAWWNRFEADLGERNTTRSWPSEGEVASSCKAVSDYSGSRIAEAGSFDPHQIAAKRIAENEAIGDEWLYGRKSAELVRRGLATEGALRPYRSALYFRAKDLWGQERAAEYERELQDKHQDALKSMREPSERMNVAAIIPDKSLSEFIE